MATDKIEVEKLSVIKGREGRDLDKLVDENTLITGETSAGVFGVFKFFEGIKAFFKGITALGTLAKTNKIPVLQDDGSLKFTTPADITSGLATTTELNNALANLTELKFNSSPASLDGALNKFEIFIYTATENDAPLVNSRQYQIVSSRGGSRGFQYAEPHNWIGDVYRRQHTGTWGEWKKVITETDIESVLSSQNGYYDANTDRLDRTNRETAIKYLLKNGLQKPTFSIRYAGGYYFQYIFTRLSNASNYTVTEINPYNGQMTWWEYISTTETLSYLFTK